jgi:hypothetical protein
MTLSASEWSHLRHETTDDTAGAGQPDHLARLEFE